VRRRCLSQATEGKPPMALLTAYTVGKFQGIEEVLVEIKSADTLLLVERLRKVGNGSWQ
jgi:hypothetical protein